MLDPKLEAALNKQVNAELWSAYLYLSMSYDMSNKGFGGFSAWFSHQAKEEFEHASKFVKYIQDRDGKVKLMPIEEVRQEWNSAKDAFEDTLMHEKIVTGLIHKLMDMAVELKDYASQGLLQWYVDEQVEEEDTARSCVDALKKIEGDTAAMYMYNKFLGKRKED